MRLWDYLKKPSANLEGFFVNYKIKQSAFSYQQRIDKNDDS